MRTVLIGLLAMIAMPLLAADLDTATTFAQAAPLPPNATITTPVVQSISPAFGPPRGGTQVLIKATNVDQVTAVHFGGAAATIHSVTHSDPPTTLIDVRSPAGVGVVDVTVTGPAGTSAPVPADRFAYVPNVTALSPAAGPAGTPVVIHATNLLDEHAALSVTAVNFGTTPASSFKLDMCAPTDPTPCIVAVAPTAPDVIVDVTLIGPGGTSVQTPADQFSYAPEITGIIPSAGPQDTHVTIHGSGIVNGKGESIVTGVSFGTTPARFRVYPTCTTKDPAPCVDAVAPAGADVVDVTLTGPGGTSVLSEADEFSYAPEITAISPLAGPAGATVSIHGSGFFNRRGESVITAVNFGAAPATILGAHAKCSTAEPTPCIIAKAPPGADVVDVTLTSPGGTSQLVEQDEFSYAPQVASIKPPAGSAGTRVTIHGSGFLNRKGESTITAVNFGATPAATFNVEPKCSANDPTVCIIAIAPAGTKVVDVTLIGAGGVSEVSPLDRFSYAPVVTNLTPSFGPAVGGTAVIIHGVGFVDVGSGPAVTGVSFGTSPATVGFATADSVVAIAPAGTGIVDVTVATAGGTSLITANDQFSYLSPIPTVTSVSPGSGSASGGTSLVIHGTGFTGALAVAFDSASASSFGVDSDTQITATSPAGTGTVDVRVTTPGGISATNSADQFMYIGNPPSVASVSPSVGPTGGNTLVTISGSGFTHAQQVSFGTVIAPATFSIVSDTQIMVASPPAAAGSVDVTVTGTAGTSMPGPADRFTYVAVPLITSIVPSSGPPRGGTQVTINGSNLSGATTVNFGSAPAATFTNNSDTQLTATSPAGSGTVDVTVTTIGGTSATVAADQFTYSGAGRGYVANAGDNTVSVIDIGTNRVLRNLTIPAAPDQPGVSPAPDALAIDSSGTRLYVGGRNNNTIYALDAASGTVLGTFNTLAAGGACNPIGLGLSADGTRLYVEGASCTTVSVLDTTTPAHMNQVTSVANIAEGGKVAVGGGVANFGDNGTAVSGGALQQVSTTTNTLVGAFLGSPVLGVAVDFSQTHLWFAGGTTIQFRDIGCGCSSMSRTLGTALRGVAAAQGTMGDVAAVADGTNTLWIVVFPGESFTFTPVTVGQGPLGTALAPDATRAYVTNQTDNTVSVVDTSADSVVATIPVGSSPTDIVTTPVIPQ